MFVVVCSQTYSSGCYTSGLSHLMLLRLRVWQMTLHEPKWPRINFAVILMAKNTNKVVFGIDSCCSELLTLVREKINAVLWPIKISNMTALYSVGFWRTILTVYTGIKRHNCTFSKSVSFWFVLAFISLLPPKQILQLCGANSWCVIVWNACLLIILHMLFQFDI